MSDKLSNQRVNFKHASAYIADFDLWSVSVISIVSAPSSKVKKGGNRVIIKGKEEAEKTVFLQNDEFF